MRRTPLRRGGGHDRGGLPGACPRPRRAPGPDSGRESLSLLLARAEHAVRRRLAPSLAQAGLAFEHWRILSVLLERPGLPMAALAEAAVVPAATLTRHVDRLVEHALVVRRIDPADKRRAVTALSPTGRDLAEVLRAEERAVESGLADALGHERYAALTRDLGTLPGTVG
ncbi:MarR family winged helix-turn-helix transcriptional regulator [Nocardioides sp. SOB77]|uniref:MarR family winged helix-turn-helix transcriptional regulator n=1 Tax=Nocardioides oceani TaxID=3058369 RepID=A0ABT8FFC5_9ACTN|nr:MarR family winged helix-turn-helix transcriptional regulator [Nocardioides oceani]MDN4173150.1 MarR family winged helix-turn-helix transcriptional regulator [Nocardioides oceani]